MTANAGLNSARRAKIMANEVKKKVFGKYVLELRIAIVKISSRVRLNLVVESLIAGEEIDFNVLKEEYSSESENDQLEQTAQLFLMYKNVRMKPSKRFHTNTPVATL